MRLDSSAKRGQPGLSGQKQSRNPANAADERASPLGSVMQVNDCIENRTFDEIAVGESASLTRTLSKDDIALFAVMSGDVNPTHLDERYAETSMFHRITAHGMWSGALP